MILTYPSVEVEDQLLCIVQIGFCYYWYLMFVKCEIESSVDWVEEISLGNQLSCFGIQVSEWHRFLISGD